MNMVKYMKIAAVVLGVILVMLLFNSGNAAEPERPDVNHVFDFEKEAKINDVVNLPTQEAFEKLKGLEFLINDNLLHKAVFKTFKNRKKEGINLALNYLKLPEREIINGKSIDRTNDFYVVKKIFEVFPEESVNKILKLYKNGDAVTRGNIIRASGNVSGNAVRKLLIKALNDKAVCEEEYPEMAGEPLRICDVAYNQLVLRYNIKNVLRTIGNVYRIEVRDYNIDILKSKL
jgi:hypothetical protein